MQPLTGTDKHEPDNGGSPLLSLALSLSLFSFSFLSLGIAFSYPSSDEGDQKPELVSATSQVSFQGFFFFLILGARTAEGLPDAHSYIRGAAN